MVNTSNLEAHQVTRRDELGPLQTRMTVRFDRNQADIDGGRADGCVREHPRTPEVRPQRGVGYAEVSTTDGRMNYAGGGPHRHLCSVHEIEQMPWVGREVETREMCVAILKARSVLQPAGALVDAATNALVVLELAAGHYAAALELLHNRHDNDPDGYRDPTSLPDMVEAGIRGGDRPLASRALRHLQAHVRTKPTRWGLGVLARSSAVHTTDDDPERLYLEAISHLRAAGTVPDLARTHLLLGEWLRRQRRRAEARSHLRRAHNLFLDMGAGCFADRAAIELVATGEHVRKRTMDTQNSLTPHELHIASLAAAHATNREIATQLFISARTVEYHLHHVFQKLQISSRRQLSTAMAHVPDVVGLNALTLGVVG